MTWHRMKTVSSTALAFLIVVLALSVAYADVHAQESQELAPRFSLSPVNAGGDYFDLTLSPGDTRQIDVEIHNTGTAAGRVSIYTANVTTRVNGGVAAGLAEETTSGPSLWLDLVEETVSLEAAATVTKTLTIRVPDDAAPGEHMMSIVVQEASDNVNTDSASGVELKTVSRQALPILITLPGTITPALNLGSVEHTVAGGRSVVVFTASNTGNVRIRPTGDVTIADNNGNELARTTVQYASVYAGTNTTLEVPLDFLLEPGDYTANLQLDDSTHNSTFESGPLPLRIEQSDVAAAKNSQGTGSTNGTEAPTAVETEVVGIPTWTLLVAIPVAIVAGVVIALGTVQLSRRRARPDVDAPQSA